MTATVTDERRRLVMPPELPARSAVTVQRVDEDTWIVRRQKPHDNLVLVALPRVAELPNDPGWEAKERQLAAHSFKRLPKFEE